MCHMYRETTQIPSSTYLFYLIDTGGLEITIPNSLVRLLFPILIFFSVSVFTVIVCLRLLIPFLLVSFV